MKRPETIFDFLSLIEFPAKSVVFELGAADGRDTKRIIDSIGFDGGCYYAIEPEPRNLRTLKASVSGIDGCFVLPVAIGNQNRPATFYQSWHEDKSRSHTESGSLKKPKEHLDIYPWCVFNSEITVPMVRLDDLASLLSIDRVDFIWSDIQGADDWFIEGARNVLSRTQYLYTECFEERLYDGQLNYTEMVSAMPGRWKTVCRFEHDVLFKRE